MSLKLMFLDMEGTLYEKQRISYQDCDDAEYHSFWSRLMHELGPEALEADTQTFKKWEAGQYSNYMEWCFDCVKIFKKFGLTRSKFYEILDSIPFSDKVPDTINQLHRRGVRTAIISGGFVEQARRAQATLKITHAYASTELFWDENGHIVHWNLFPSDFEGKVDFMRLLIREYQLTPDQCGFVGDGANDVALAKQVGFSVAYQGHPKLKSTAKHSIEHFTEILELIAV